jgi:2-methyl-3-hydroxypyridine 5-carboxylic acid dioxygenase
MEAMMVVSRHAEIAGAGFAGLVAAIALRQRGWTVRVHEASHELRAFGAGIFIWENGLRVLKAIDAYDDVMGCAHEAIVYETRHNDRIVAEYAFTSDKGTRMLTLTRQHLYDAILHVAERERIDIITGSEVTGASPRGTLTIASGRDLAADLVIGADGVKSRVRDSIALLKERNVYGDGIIRVLAPRMKTQLGVGDCDHVIDFWHLEPRPLRILYVPCNDAQLYLAMMAPVSDREASAIPVRQDVWIEAFPQLEPVLREVSAGGRYDAYETSKLHRWSCGPVAVIGDAAHAMAPTLGQGAGMAVSNALALAVYVTELPSLEQALQVWEERERPLTEYTQDSSATVARERAMSRGKAWNEDTLRAANHVPTGTEHIPCLLGVSA